MSNYLNENILDYFPEGFDNVIKEEEEIPEEMILFKRESLSSELKAEIHALYSSQIDFLVKVSTNELGLIRDLITKIDIYVYDYDKSKAIKAISVVQEEVRINKVKQLEVTLTPYLKNNKIQNVIILIFSILLLLIIIKYF